MGIEWKYELEIVERIEALILTVSSVYSVAL
jgi:hypothetical protein